MPCLQPQKAQRKPQTNIREKAVDVFEWLRLQVTSMEGQHHWQVLLSSPIVQMGDLRLVRCMGPGPQRLLKAQPFLLVARESWVVYVSQPHCLHLQNRSENTSTRDKLKHGEPWTTMCT